MSSTNLNSTDISFFFTTGGGPLGFRSSNLGGDISALSDAEIVSSQFYNWAPDPQRSTIGNIGSTGTWNMYFPGYVYNKNTNSVTVTSLKMWIYKNVNNTNLGIKIGKDPVGKNGIMQTIPNQTTKPTGVTFYQPFAETDFFVLTLDSLSAGDKWPFWVNLYGNKGIASIAAVRFGLMVSFQRPVS